MKRTLILIASALVLLSLFYLMWRMYASERTERRRLEANQHSLLTETRLYRTRDSLSAASVEKLTLSNREFRESCEELQQTVSSLELKVRRLQSVSRTSIATARDLTLPVRDTVILHDILPPDTVRLLNFSDPWLTLDGRLQDHVFNGHVESRDTLIQVVHRVPRRFWFIRWGTKAIRQEVLTRNPYSRITYTEYIELKRK